MLPSSLQITSGILLVVGGLLACFAGHRLFRLVLGIYGFLLGALAASSLMGPSDTASMLVSAGIGGLIGAVILMLAYFIGVALVGAGLGALAANLIWGQMGGQPHALILIAFSIGGAMAALAMQRYVIIFGTSFGGAWTTVVGALALIGNRPALAAAERGDVWLAYPMNPAAGERWVVIAFMVLGIAGLIVQLTITAKDKRK